MQSLEPHIRREPRTIFTHLHISSAAGYPQILLGHFWWMEMRTTNQTMKAWVEGWELTIEDGGEEMWLRGTTSPRSCEAPRLIPETYVIWNQVVSLIDVHSNLPSLHPSTVTGNHSMEVRFSFTGGLSSDHCAPLSIIARCQRSAYLRSSFTPQPHVQDVTYHVRYSRSSSRSNPCSWSSLRNRRSRCS